jgi:hypothetical protein
MISALKGKISERLLGASSHHPVNQASLVAAAGISICLAVVCSVFAFAQWRVAGEISRLQRQQSFEFSQRVAAAADMATRQANSHRATLNCLLSRDVQELDEQDDLRRKNLENYSALVARYENSGAMLELTRKYEDDSKKVVDLFRAGQREEAIDRRISELRPIFNQWQDAHNAFTKALAAQDMQQQKIFNQSIASMQKLLMGLLLTPVILILASIVAIAATLGFERIKGKKADIWTR